MCPHPIDIASNSGGGIRYRFLELVSELIQEFDVSLDRLVSVRISGHIHNVAVLNCINVLQSVVVLQNFLRRGGVVIDGCVAVEDEDPLRVSGNNCLNGNLVALVVIGGILNLQCRGQAENRVQRTNGTTLLRSDKPDLAAGDVYCEDLLVGIVSFLCVCDGIVKLLVQSLGFLVLIEDLAKLSGLALELRVNRLAFTDV